MANEIKLKRGSGSDPSASDLVVGEVAVRTDNGTLFTKKDDGNVAEIGAAAGVSDGDKGDITVSNSGATFTIDSGVIDNANVASDAAIAGSKINPSFGNQAVTSTNSITLDGSVGDTIIKASGAEIEFTRGASNNITCSDSSGSLNINTAGSTRMNIGSNGNVGIGTTSPQENLHILSSSGSARMRMTSADGSDNMIVFGDASDQATGSIKFDHSDNSLAFLGFNNSERMRIDSSGKVSIANTGLTTSSSADELVIGTTSGNRGLTIFSGTSNTGNIFFGDTDTSGTGNRMGTITYDHSGNFMRFSTNGNQERIRIDSSGNVVVGGTSAQASDAATLMADGEVTAAGFYFSNNIGSAMNSEGIRRKTTNTIAFDTNSTERMTLNNSGLDVTGNITGTGSLSADGFSTTGGEIALTGTVPRINLVDSNANSDFRLKCDGGSFHIEDITNAGNRLSIDSSGDVIIHNDLDFPDSSKIKFGASDDLTITHDGSHSRISDIGTGILKIETDSAVHINKGTSENMAKFIVDGQVELYFDNSKKLSTASDGITVTGRIVADELDMGDNDKVKLGTGDDFELFHDGSHARIDNSTGYITLDSAFGHILRNGDGSETLLRADVNGSVELYENGTKRIETTDTGATITGDAIIDAVKVGAWSGGSTYKGIFHSSQSSSEYMMINNDGHTFISATGSHNVYIRNGANDSTNQLIVASGNDGLTWRGNKVFHAGNDGSGSGLDADSVDGIAGSSLLRSDAADTASGDITFSGGAGAATIAANSDIRLTNGDWTGDHAAKIQHHNNYLYISGGTSGIIFREVGVSRWLIDGDGHFDPAADSTYDIGSNGVRVRNGYFDTLYGDGSNLTGVLTSVVDDTSPQLGGDLDTNSHEILLDDDHAVKFGNDTDLTIKHTGSNGAIDNVTGDLYIKTTGSGDDIVLISNDDIELQPQAGEDGLKVKGNGAVEAYFNNVLKVKTQTDHINIGCNLSSNPFDYLRFGASLFGAADIAPHNAGSHTVGLSFRTDSTADTTINPTEAMRISANGNIGAPNGSNIYNASDSRFKQNVTTLDKGLSAINSLRPVSFNWVEGFCDEEKDTLYGFIAQEVQTVDANLISQFAPGRTITIEETTIENALTVNEKFIIPMLVKAVQELTAKVTALES